jgi:hypothetical protein
VCNIGRLSYHVHQISLYLLTLTLTQLVPAMSSIKAPHYYIPAIQRDDSGVRSFPFFIPRLEPVLYSEMAAEPGINPGPLTCTLGLAPSLYTPLHSPFLQHRISFSPRLSHRTTWRSSVPSSLLLTPPHSPTPLLRHAYPSDMLPPLSLPVMRRPRTE